MKKLIEEIETRANESATREGVHSSPFEEGVAVGLNIALQIVKSHDPWIDVGELPPSRDEKGDYIQYLFKFDDTNDVYIAFNDGEERWYEVYDESFLMIGKYGAKWTYLPEVLS